MPIYRIAVNLTKLTISIAEWWLTKLKFWVSVPTYG